MSQKSSTFAQKFHAVMKNTENEFTDLIRFVEQKDLVLKKEVCFVPRGTATIRYDMWEENVV